MRRVLYAYGSRNCRFLMIYSNYRVSMRLHFQAGVINYTTVTRLQGDTYFVPTASGAFIFLTCFAVKNYTISTCTKPLQIAVWIAILPFTAFLTIFVLVVAKLKPFINPPWQFFYSTLLEHSFTVPEYIGKTTCLGLSLCLGFWLLLSFLMDTNFFNHGAFEPPKYS